MEWSNGIRTVYSIRPAVTQCGVDLDGIDSTRGGRNKHELALVVPKTDSSSAPPYHTKVTRHGTQIHMKRLVPGIFLNVEIAHSATTHS
jgi:hypothetical protein